MISVIKLKKTNFSKKSESIVEAVEEMMGKKELKKKPKQGEVKNGHNEKWKKESKSSPAG